MFFSQILKKNFYSFSEVKAIPILCQLEKFCGSSYIIDVFERKKIVHRVKWLVFHNKILPPIWCFKLLRKI